MSRPPPNQITTQTDTTTLINQIKKWRIKIMKKTIINTSESRIEVNKAILSNKSMKDFLDTELTVTGVITIYDDESEQKMTMIKTVEEGYICTLSEKTFDDVAPIFADTLEELESFKIIPRMIKTKNGRDFITYDMVD